MPYFVDKETMAEFARNSVLLKRVKRINSIAFFTYLIGGLIMIPYSFTSMVGTSWDWLMGAMGEPYFAHVAFILIIDTLIVCPLSFYLTYRASLLHHSLSAMIVIAIQVANYIFMIVLNNMGFFGRIRIAFIGMSVYSVACILTGGANMWAVIKYHWLEDQEGFPQFSATFEEYKEKQREREIMDPYELRKRQLQRGSSGEMNDLGTTQDELEHYEKVHVPSNMDSI
ncbi:MAG: hypothetical protein Q4A05_04540 [Ruminococcus sp.]|nr:hypothetical protein [Ruminococcus sp.]